MVLRAALVGCGDMSRAWLDAAHQIEGLRITGLADLDLDRAARRAASAGLSGIVIERDVDALLDRARPDILFDVAVPDARPGIVRAGLSRGCHVLTEKPLAPSIEEARSLVAMARDVARVHAVIQNRRYHPGVRRLRRFLSSGAIGDITGLYVDFFKAPHFGGFREQMRHVLLLDMAIHTFDTARLFAGRTPRGAYCLETNPEGSWYRHGAAASVIFDLPGGIPLVYRGSWCAEGVQTSWESSWRIVGTCGTVIWDGEERFEAERAVAPPASGLFAVTEPLDVPPLDPRDAIGGHLGVLRDFIGAVRDGGEPETVSHDNIHSLAMVFAAIESAELCEHVLIGTET